ncbi:MAG: hypothetical protein Ctma_0965 [Catillopecten margaritatus gill symbiont]|uniref:Uncharacterized protein n=1 Tax=Catillopecten margaritatus gill symbiont TaxID=3083288 RepID=A0AAU6PGY2_9GAMM
MGVNNFDIQTQTKKLNNQILNYEHQLENLNKEEDSRWGENEQMLLGVKHQLQSLKKKMKLEGDWGEIKLRVQDLRGNSPGAVKLKYNYGF